MSRITALAIVLAAPPLGCGVPQARYDALVARAHRLERQAQRAEARRPPSRRCARPRPHGCDSGAALRRCRRALQATRRPLVLASHTLEQDIGGGGRRASTVTLRPGTVLLPLSPRPSRRNRLARRAERSLRRSLARHLSTVAACYHRQVKRRRRPPEGQLSFAFELTGAGRIRRVTLVHRLLRDPATVRCTLGVLRRLRFPRQRRALWAVFPLEFHTSRRYPSAAPPPARSR